MKAPVKASFLLVSLIWMMSGIGITPAFPQRVMLSGHVNVGFGRLKKEGPPVITEADGVGEAAVMFRGVHGPFKASIELGMGEDPDLVQWAQHEVVWQPAEYFALTLSGSSFDLPATEGVISVINAPAGQVGDKEVDLDFSGLGLMDLSFILGDVTFGLAMVDNCQPECGYAVDSVDGPFNPDAERMTGIAHLAGHLGGFSYNAYAAGSRGQFVEGDLLTPGKGSGGGIGLVYGTDRFRMALESSRATIQCVAAPGDVPCTEDNVVEKNGAAISVGGLGVHYYREMDSIGKEWTRVSNVDLVYVFDFDVAEIGPEYRTLTRESKDVAETTDSFFLLGISRDF